MEITIKPQEENSNSKFDGSIIVTKNFLKTFGPEAFQLAAQTLTIIQKELVPRGADYLQVCEYGGITFWIIDNGRNVTILMPNDY